MLWSSLWSWAERNISFACYGVVLLGYRAAMTCYHKENYIILKLFLSLKYLKGRLKIKILKFQNWKLLKNIFKKISVGGTSKETFAHLKVCHLHSQTPGILGLTNPFMAWPPTPFFFHCSPKNNITRKSMVSLSYKIRI